MFMNLLNPNHGEQSPNPPQDHTPIFTHPAFAPVLPLEAGQDEPKLEPVEVKTPPPVFSTEPKPLTERAIFPWLVVVGILVVLLVIFSPVVVVKAGHKGVSTFFGDTQGDIVTEGIHFKYPLLRVHQFDVRTQNIEVASGVETSDMQAVKTTTNIRYRLDEADLRDVYEDYGQDYVDMILKPTVEESIFQVGAQFTAQGLVTGLADFKEAVKTDINTRLTDTGVFVEEVAITDVSFSRALQDAFEAKALAEQAAIQQQIQTDAELAKIKQDNATALVESERIKILGEALKGHEAYIQYEIMQKWDGTSPLYLAPITPPQVINNTIENPTP